MASYDKSGKPLDGDAFQAEHHRAVLAWGDANTRYGPNDDRTKAALVKRDAAQKAMQDFNQKQKKPAAPNTGSFMSLLGGGG